MADGKQKLPSPTSDIKKHTFKKHTMRFCLLILLLLNGCLLFGQRFSVTIDSLTRVQSAHFSRAQQSWVDSILKKRDYFGSMKRVDTIACDYIFIEETYVSGHYRGECPYLLTDTAGLTSTLCTFVSERYFDRDDSIPRFVFLDGESIKPSELYHSFFGWYTQNVIYPKTLQPMIERYSKLQPNQELDYDKLLVWEHGCVTQPNGEELFRQRRADELKRMYRVQTMVDKVHNKIIVSVQTAPSDPKFEVYSYNSVWDW